MPTPLFVKCILNASAIAALLALLSLPTGCDTAPAPAPSFLRIDTIAVDSTSFDSTGSVSHAIRYAWVYANDNLLGVFWLPTVVPVLDTGDVDITVFGGISENGIATQAGRYPFYAPWQAKVNLNTMDTSLVFPRVRYPKGFIAPINQTFDQSQLNGMSLAIVQGGGFYSILLNASEAYEGQGCLQLYLPQGDQDMILETSSLPVPTGKAGYFIEMDYRNNCDFLLGLRAAGSNQAASLIGVRPRAEYNKLYVNITNLVDQLSGVSEAVHLFIRVPQDTSIADQRVYIDNLKLVY
jgi:hypothetical protein